MNQVYITNIQDKMFARCTDIQIAHVLVFVCDAYVCMYVVRSCNWMCMEACMDVYVRVLALVNMYIPYCMCVYYR